MKGKRPLHIIFFRSELGSEPVRNWLQEMSKSDRKTIGSDILAVQYAWPVGKSLVANVGSGIWEIRSKLSSTIARTIFCLVDEEIVLLHGFIKKTKTTPKQELDLAKRRKRQYLKNDKK